MNFQFSIIIICKNEAPDIERSIISLQSLSDDIVAFDNGSTDNTVEILKKYAVHVYEGSWEGFGKTRQKAVEFASHDWVMIVDADEVVTETLANELKQLQLTNPEKAYRIELKNHIGSRQIKWGAWGHDKRVRLYNKKMISWNDSMVHEKLIIPQAVEIIDLQNPILHYTVANRLELSQKMKSYALLTAEQYFRKGRRSTWIKRNFSSFFTFLKTYFFQFGFLDGTDGYYLARIIANYTWLKYKRLFELEKGASS